MTEEIIETGLAGLTVTATVTEPEPPAPAPVPAVVTTMPSGWNLNKVASLVRDVAHNMYDIEFILKTHSLTAAEYAVLQKNEYFEKALAAEIITWQSSGNVKQRLALQAAIAVEDAMPTLAARLSKGQEPLTDVVALLKVFSEIAGTIGAKAAAQAPAIGEKFKIVINLGADTISREATRPMLDITPPSDNAVQSLIEAAGVPAAVQINGKGT